jgi:MraZ protein
LLPKFLLEYAGIKNDVVLACQLNKIEMWDAEAHKAAFANEPQNFSALAQRVMGNKARRGDE